MFTSDVSVFLEVKQITALSRTTSGIDCGSCCSSWHTQKPPPFPPHHAHVRLCCGCASFITVHTWVRNSFDSSWMTELFCWLVRKPGLWFEACFCLYHSLKQGNIGMNKVARQQQQSEATAWMLGRFEWNNPSMITARHLRGSGLWRYVSLDTKKIYVHVEGEVR